MTKNQRRQFYSRLRKIKDKFEWYLIFPKQIRGKLKDSIYDNFCPITAIAYSETGNIYDSSDADRENVSVGFNLSEDDRNSIMMAADSSRLALQKEKIIRKTMLKIVELG